METPRLTPELLRGLPKAGGTDPIEYYRRPLVGRLYRERINLGLQMLPPNIFDRALEIGYAAGAVQLALAPRAKEMHGIDLDADPVEVGGVLAQRGLSSKLVKGTVYELPYPDSHFQLVVCFSVFEHLDDYARALSEVARVLEPTMYFLLGMPAVNRFMEAAFAAIGYREIDHQHVTTPQQVKSRFHEFGFRVIGDNHLYFPSRIFSRAPIAPVLYYNWLLTRVPAARRR